MSEKRFLSFILIEGSLLAVLGFLILILPKLTTITFGLLLCLSFIIYGGYKTICAFLTRNYSRHYIFDSIIGLLLFGIGILLFAAPIYSLILVSTCISLYFILESIASAAFAFQTKNTLYLWWAKLVIGFIQFFLGLIILIAVPASALWGVGILVGMCYLITGCIMLCMYIAAKYIYS